MDKFNMLSGEQLVQLGAKKASVSLPELGVKEVFPNGSWLEQKQIQNSLEARKYLVEVERIDKCGSISHAQWREDLHLAEVTEKCGGHWQYLGHNVGKVLYITPEEALFLMELNCLQLKYNDVTVSIQQAYSLLLGKEISLVQYKVYASLGRLGYKVFRYDHCLNTETVEAVQGNDVADQEVRKQTSESIDDGKESDHNKIQENVTCEDNATIDVQNDGQSVIIDKEMQFKEKENESTMGMEHTSLNLDVEVRPSVDLSNENIENTSGDIKSLSLDACNTGSTAFIQQKLQSLCNRELRPCNSDVVHQSFDENLPDLFQKHVVTVKAPEERLIPRNVFLNNTAYVLNLENMRLKNVIPLPSSSSQSYGSSDEVNERHVRRIRSSLSHESAQSNYNTQFFPRFPQQTNQFRQFNYWNNFNVNFAFQRQFFQSLPLRFQVFPRMQPMFRYFPAPPSFMPNVDNSDMGRPRKRKVDNAKKYHLKSIKNLALKLKNLVSLGNTQAQNIQALQRLIETYNQRYKAKLELTEELDVLENELILETIDLDDDDQTSPKKKRTVDEDQLFEDNFAALKKFALKIKELEDKNESSPQHRRALSKAIKTFNKSYSADIYVDSNYEVINRRHIVIASSSDSETAVEATPKPRRKSKKLRNPFYIMKRLSEKQNAIKSQHSTDESSCYNAESIGKRNVKYNETLKNNVGKHWLPSENDFGRAEVVQKNQFNIRLLDHSQEFLYEFMKGHLYDNWVDAKIAYWQSCEESAKKFETSSHSQSSFNLNSLLSPEDCTDLQSVLKKLNIIKTNKDVKDECSLRIHFDVYNRDVPNFKKTNKPNPHFRVICIEESSNFPDGIDFATHHQKYTDDVSIVFAIVGTSSISYLQINATDLPVYIPTGNPP